jgi:hypothetical protein
LIRVLVPYFLASLVFSLLCGAVGRSFHPLAAFQVYALGCACCLVLALLGGRLLGVWRWRRLFPPTAAEAITAASSVLILTASTLAMLAPASLTSAVVMRAGALLLVASRRALLLPLLAAAAAALSACSLHALEAAPVPLGLAAVYVAGYWLKLYATRGAPAAADFLAAEQVVVGLLCLAVGGLFSHVTAPAPLADPRLWGVAAASTAAGLLGTRLLLRAEPASITFSAYKSTGLLAAAAATLARGERLGPGSWVAFGLALVVIFLAARRAR